MNDKYLISAMALDLKRASMGSEIFLKEFFNKRKKLNTIPDKLRIIFKKINLNTDKEDLLMYSVLLQNYAGGKSKN